MPFEAKLTSCLVGVAMALSPYAMVMPAPVSQHCNMEDGHPEDSPDHQSSMACHAACLGKRERIEADHQRRHDQLFEDSKAF